VLFNIAEEGKDYKSSRPGGVRERGRKMNEEGPVKQRKSSKEFRERSPGQREKSLELLDTELFGKDIAMR